MGSKFESQYELSLPSLIQVSPYQPMTMRILLVTVLLVITLAQMGDACGGGGYVCPNGYKSCNADNACCRDGYTCCKAGDQFGDAVLPHGTTAVLIDVIAQDKLLTVLVAAGVLVMAPCQDMNCMMHRHHLTRHCISNQNFTKLV